MLWVKQVETLRGCLWPCFRWAPWVLWVYHDLSAAACRQASFRRASESIFTPFARILSPPPPLELVNTMSGVATRLMMPSLTFYSSTFAPSWQFFYINELHCLLLTKWTQQYSWLHSHMHTWTCMYSSCTINLICIYTFDNDLHLWVQWSHDRVIRCSVVSSE